MHGPNIEREWGSHRILEDAPQYKIKELVLKPGKSLATKRYQLLKHWFVLSGECEIETVYLESPNVIPVKQGHSYCIGVNVWHLARNTGKEDCHILEVRYGAEEKI